MARSPKDKTPMPVMLDTLATNLKFGLSAKKAELECDTCHVYNNKDEWVRVRIDDESQTMTVWGRKPAVVDDEEAKIEGSVMGFFNIKEEGHALHLARKYFFKAEYNGQYEPMQTRLEKLAKDMSVELGACVLNGKNHCHIYTKDAFIDIQLDFHPFNTRGYTIRVTGLISKLEDSEARIANIVDGKLMEFHNIDKDEDALRLAKKYFLKCGYESDGSE